MKVGLINVFTSDVRIKKKERKKKQAQHESVSGECMLG